MSSEGSRSRFWSFLEFTASSVSRQFLCPLVSEILKCLGRESVMYWFQFCYYDQCADRSNTKKERVCSVCSSIIGEVKA